MAKPIQEGIRDHGAKTMSEAAGTMTSVLETGKPGIVTHKEYGNIVVDAGKAESRSFGLRHIIKQRHDEGKPANEMAALLILLNGTLKNGKKTRDIKFARQPDHLGRMELDAGGIVAIVSRQREQGDNEQWVLTGFEDRGNKEAADAIQKVISRYGYAPEFLGLEKQVGAVVSSIDKISHESIKKSSQKNETAVLNDLKKLSDILLTGKTQTVENKDVGAISVDRGNLGKSGYGLLHIIEGRNIKDRLNNDEITAMLYRVVNAAEEGRIVDIQPKMARGKDTERIGIEKNGIIAILSKARNGKDEKFVITGYGMNEKKEEATEAIRTVIARYGRSPEFSDFRRQVGAAVSSIDKISHESLKKSSQKTNTVQAYLDGIEIKNIDDFKYQLKALPMMFPSEFGKDSIKAAKTLLKALDENTKKTVGGVLTELGCSNPEKTKEKLDRWAGIGQEKNIEKKPEKHIDYWMER